MRTPDIVNEKELLGRIGDGDESAFQLLYEHYWPLMYANVLQFMKDAEYAKDLTQDIFLKIWLKRENLAGVIHFRAYFYTVAKNMILDALRKKVLIVENEEYLSAYIEDSSSQPHHVLENKELDRIINEAIENLPEQVRIAFTLKRRHGFSHDEIGKQMNISSVTSRSYITRAGIAVKNYLKNKFPVFF